MSGFLKNKLPIMIKKNMDPLPDSIQTMLIETVIKADNEVDRMGKLLLSKFLI